MNIAFESQHSLADLRNLGNKADLLFNSTAQTATYQGKTVCLNSEKNYDSLKVSDQITSMITNHISKKYPAIEVVPTGDLDSDFEVAGEIKEYFAFQETSAAARVGAQFGLIGALFTMNTTSVGEISIVLNNIQIKDSAGNMVSNIGAIEKKWDGQFKIDGYCWSP